MTEWHNAIEKSLDWIEENITEKFYLLDLANQAGYSPFYFSRLFRFFVGTTIKKYDADRRLYRAAHDIQNTKERIIDIAVKYGFSSQEALTRALKSAYGYTPYVFRNNPGLISLSTQKVVLLPENYFVKGEKSMSKLEETNGASTNLVGINLITADPKRLANFYKDVLGAEIDESHGGPHRIEIWFGPRSDSTVLIVANFDEGSRPQKYNAYRGFELRVSDADAEYKRICNLGVEIKEPPTDLPWGYRYFNIQDPDGNNIDLVAQL